MSHRELGQTSAADSPRKRPRRVISCLRCRQKKLKCDRATPCENCCKAGCPSDCAFQHGPGGEPKRIRLDEPLVANRYVPPPNTTGAGIIESLQHRLTRLEALLCVPPDPTLPNISPSHDNATLSSAPHPYLETLVVKGTRTRYHGQNSRITLLNQFAEAKGFIKECTNDSTVLRLAKEVQFLQSKSRLPIGSPESISDVELSHELKLLQASLPPIEVCDHLLSLYSTNFEQVFRILHIPTLNRQYVQFVMGHDQDSRRFSAFIPQLTAVLAVAFPLVDQEFRRDHPTACEYLQGSAANLVRDWLQKRSRKQRTELATLQTAALVVLARRLRLESPEEVWCATGSLVRSAMVMGLHLDLSSWVDLSVYQKEVRRRLWISVVEMDLQASIESGMPVNIPDMNFGPLTPTNLNDVDYDEDTAELPPAKPLREWTDALTQIILTASIRQRTQAMSLVRTANLNPDSTEFVKQFWAIEACLGQIPPMLKLDPGLMFTERPSRVLNRILLDLYIRRPLLCLSQLVLKPENPDNQLSHAIQGASLHSSLSILAYQDYFDPTVADLDARNPIVYWDLFHTFCKLDMLQSALNVCGHITLAPNHSSTPLTKATLTLAVEHALDGLTRTLGQPGSNMKDILLLAVVLQTVQARGSNEEKKQFIQQGVTSALSACRQHLLSLSLQGFENWDVAGLPQMSSPSQLIFASVGDAGYMPLPQLSDILGNASALATEFDSFIGDSLGFDDGAFNPFFATYN
ncbi:hypothetical protein BDW59DRAFT_130268 [Aspergillus cavernicola]|uniref:Zn(2)-C6 fungal-type domain-containing protein n=1 Tax=Aspergillus cavernicola TaxID=176166 RepID=A0ABR4HT69_9EURO